MLVKLGRDDDALKSFEKAIGLDPDYARAHYNKALCYALQKEFDVALEALQQAIRLDPEYKEEARTDPAFDELWEDAWFRELVEQ